MTQPTTELRHATALVHAVPSAELRLRTVGEHTLVVGRHPSADVSPCEWRRFVAAPNDPMLERMRDDARVEGLGGSLRSIGGGVYEDRGDAGTRWLTTELSTEAVAAALSAAPVDAVARRSVTATVRPDDLLGVSLVRLRTDAVCVLARFDEMAIDVAAALMVVELAGTLEPVADREGTI